MEPQDKELGVCVPGPSELAVAAKLPALVNTTDIRPGEELLWEAMPKAAQKKEAVEETWRTDANKRAKGKASGQPPSKKTR
eukprot:3913004-Pyramimonas_sp.AAC.1